MAIELKFDTDKQIIAPTFILTRRNGDRINMINNIDTSTIRVSEGFNQATEVGFTVYKQDLATEEECLVWDELKDFKLVYSPEWNTFFEMAVTINDDNDTLSKSVTMKHLPECELSRINVYNLEINTEQDINRTEEERPTTIIYNNENTEFSLLHRLFENAPHYVIDGCDSSLRTLVRNFSWDSKNIKSCLDELCEELQAIVEYKTYIDGSGNMIRSIYLHDLLSSCHNPQCSYYTENHQVYRGEVLDECPECGSDLITEGYGEDTSIFVTADCLGDDIKYENNKDQTKNCFRLIAGDDLMTETIANCNPNGGKYLWYWSDKFTSDMSDELKSKLIDINNPNSYQYLYNHYMNDFAIEFTSTSADYRRRTNTRYYLPLAFFNSYHSIVNKYNIFREQDEQFMLLPNDKIIQKYANITKYIYDMIDLGWFIKTSMYPSWSNEGATTAEIQANRIIAELQNSSVAVASNTEINTTNANSAVLNLAKLIVDNRYKVKIATSTLNGSTDVWQGSLTVVNYSDNEDTYTTGTITISINKDFETYVKQTLKQKLDDFAQKNDKYDITGLFNKNLSDFQQSLTYYSLDALNRFYDCCQGLINVLLEQGTSSISSQEFNTLYQSYLDKSTAISNEIVVRENDLFVVLGKYYDYEFDVSETTLTDSDIRYELQQLDSNNDINYGLYRYFNDELERIKASLDIRTILGETLYKEFCSYKCEDVYKNENYTSDGIDNNAELFKSAERFLEKAREDIYKSGNSQHKITAKLKNLLVIEDFEPLVNHFKVGNWLRVKVDDTVYRLRLLNYELNFGDLEDLDVEFSEISETQNGFTDIKEILDTASSMSTSYNFVHRQAYNAQESKNQINDWFQNGLNLTHTKLVSSADNQDQVWDDKGMLFRKYVPELNGYDSEQFKIINHTIALTNDNWQSTKVALGKFIYQDPADNTVKYGYGLNAETLVGKVILGNELGIYNSDNSLKFNNSGLVINNNTNKVTINPSSTNLFKIEKIVNNTTTSLLSVDSNGNLSITGAITATSLDLTTNNVTIPYARLTGTPTIPTNVTDLIGGTNILHTTDMQVTSTTIDGVTIKNITFGGHTFKEISSGDFVYTNVGLSDSNSDSYFKITNKGLLTANNAVINGTICANGGQIAGLMVELATVGNYTGNRLYNTGTDTSINPNVSYNTGINAYGLGAAFYAGEKTTDPQQHTGNRAAFRVYHNGSLFATNATITGDSHIGDFDITADGGLSVRNNTYAFHLLPNSWKSSTMIYYGRMGSDNNYYSDFFVSGTGDLGISGDFLSTGATIECYSDSNAIIGAYAFTDSSPYNLAKLEVANSATQGSLQTASSGNFGVWSTTESKWLIKMSLNGNMTLLGDKIRLDDFDGNYLRPSSNNGAYLGSANLRWHTVYVGTGGFNSSDRKLKDHIEYLEDDNNLEDFIMGLKPMMYTFKDGEGHRHHMGFYAQDVSENAHQTIGDIAAYQAVVLDVDKDGNIIERYYDEEADDKDLAWVLNYNELLAPVVAMLQKVNRENKAMREELNQLKNNNQEV